MDPICVPVLLNMEGGPRIQYMELFRDIILATAKTEIWRNYRMN